MPYFSKSSRILQNQRGISKILAFVLTFFLSLSFWPHDPCLCCTCFILLSLGKYPITNVPKTAASISDYKWHSSLYFHSQERERDGLSFGEISTLVHSAYTVRQARTHYSNVPSSHNQASSLRRGSEQQENERWVE